MSISIYEIHEWLDRAEDPNHPQHKEAVAIVEKWEKDIQPDQMWRMKGEENAVCTILSVDKKIKVEVDVFDPQEGPKVRIAYFGKNSFLNRWERMF